MREHRIEIEPYKIVDDVSYRITRYLNHHAQATFSGIVRDSKVDEYFNSALEGEAWVKIYFLTVAQRNIIRRIFDKLQASDGAGVLAVAKFLNVKGINYEKIDHFIKSAQPKTLYETMEALRAFRHFDQEDMTKVLQYYHMGLYMKMAGLTKVDKVFQIIGALSADAFFKVKTDPKEFTGILSRNDLLERKELIFYGVLTEFKILEDNGVKRLRGVARSGSYQMDLTAHTRVFQDPAKTYSDVLATVTREYQGEAKEGAASAQPPFALRVTDKTIAAMDQREPETAGRGKEPENEAAPPKTILVQYKETDWEFIKRLASHFGTVVIPRYRTKVESIPQGATDAQKTDKEEQIKFFFGLPAPRPKDGGELPADEDDAPATPEGFPFTEYQAIKKGALKHSGHEVSSALSSERYRVENERELYELGEAIAIVQGPGGGLELYVGQSESSFAMKGEMEHRYILKSKEALVQKKAYLDGVAAPVFNEFTNWDLEFRLLGDSKAADFDLKFNEETLSRGEVSLWTSVSQRHREASVPDYKTSLWNASGALASVKDPELHTEGVAFKSRLQGFSLLGKVTKVHDKFVEVELDEDENLPRNQKPDAEGNAVREDRAAWDKAYKRFRFSSLYASDDGSGIHWMPKIEDRVRLYFPDRDEENGYVISFFYEEGNLPSNRTDPNNTSIKNPQGKEVLFSPTSICATNNDGLLILLQQGRGIDFASNGKIQIRSSASVTIAAGGALHLSAPSGVAIDQGAASMAISPEKIQVKAHIKLSGGSELGG